jgi:hypothetical protein
MADYVAPGQQNLPFQNLPSQATPVKAEWLNGIEAALTDLAGASAGRVKALEQNPTISAGAFRQIMQSLGGGESAWLTVLGRLHWQRNHRVAVPTGPVARFAIPVVPGAACPVERHQPALRPMDRGPSRRWGALRRVYQPGPYCVPAPGRVHHAHRRHRHSCQARHGRLDPCRADRDRRPLRRGGVARVFLRDRRHGHDRLQLDHRRHHQHPESQLGDRVHRRHRRMGAGHPRRGQRPGGYTWTAYTSTDGDTWTQVGISNVTTGGATSIFVPTTTNWEIGGRGGNGSMLAGKVYEVQIRDGIDGKTSTRSRSTPGYSTRHQALTSFPALAAVLLSISSMARRTADLDLRCIHWHARTSAPGQLVFLSTSHNDADKVGASLTSAWDSWLTALKARLPGAAFCLLTQNPEISPRTLDLTKPHAQRRRELMTWAARSGRVLH